MKDPIERQDAIDAICKACANGDDYVNCRDRDIKSSWCDNIVALRDLPSAQTKTEERTAELVQNVSDSDLISRKAAIDAVTNGMCSGYDCEVIEALEYLPPAQPEDYTEMKQEFLRMASYIDVLLECSDVQKETLMGFISRLAEFMPWTERD